MMSTQLFTSCCMALAMVVGSANAISANGPLRVELTSCSRQYLLGEPVLLEALVKNTSRQAIRTYELIVQDPFICSEIAIYIARGNGSFERFTPYPCENANVEREIKIREPGDSWSYKLRVPYAYKRPDRLAFSNPGEYRIKVRYPLITPDRLKKTKYESNVVEIRVKAPGGVNREAWQQINGRDFLYFLQSGLVPKGGEERAGDIPAKAVRLVMKYPQSGYAPALKWALKEYYQRRRMEMTRDELLIDQEMQWIREVTGIKIPPLEPFPDDERLNIPITYHYAKPTPLKDVFEDISIQSGIPLRLDQALTTRSMQSLELTQPLRTFMDSMDAHKAKWIPDGDGYKLVPNAAAE